MELSPDGKGSWSAVVGIPWSCAKNVIVRNARGEFQQQDIARDCTIDNRVEIRPLAPQRISLSISGPPLPREEEPGHAQDCRTCLEGVPEETMSSKWVQVSTKY
jgi:hypothetical protein